MPHPTPPHPPMCTKTHGQIQAVLQLYNCFFSMVYIHNETMKLHLGLLNIVYHWLHMIQILWDSRAQSLENVMTLSITLAGCWLRKKSYFTNICDVEVERTRLK